jgi:hypothetical protein
MPWASYPLSDQLANNFISFSMPGTPMMATLLAISTNW